MAFVYDTGTGNIMLPAGDTADINISINYDELREGDQVIFAIFNKFHNWFCRRSNNWASARHCI